MIETINRERRSIFAGDKIMSHFPFRGSPPSNNTQVCVSFSFLFVVSLPRKNNNVSWMVRGHCNIHFPPEYALVNSFGSSRGDGNGRNNLFSFFRRNVSCATKIKKTLVNILSHLSFHWRLHTHTPFMANETQTHTRTV